MITGYDARRIADDCAIAIDALMAIEGECHRGIVHESYLAEKVRKAQSCLAFLEGFIPKKED